MHHLEDLPRVAAGPPPIEGLLPTAGAMSALCLILFALLFLV
jgi:hypothetical protein